MYNIFSNLLFGIVGGIVSSIIVSRMFWIMSDSQSVIDTLDTEYGKLCVFSGEIYTLKTIYKNEYDNSIADNEHRIPIDNNACLSSKQKLLEIIKDDANKEWINLVYLNVKGNEVIDIIDTFIAYTDKLKSMEQVLDKDINDLDRLFVVCRKKFNDYKDTNGKRLLKKLLPDKMMIVLYIVVLLIIVGTILSSVLNG